MTAELEIHERFGDLQAWLAFCGERPWLFDPATMRRIVERATEYGLESDFLGVQPPHAVKLYTGDYRESLVGGGFSSRQRLMLDVLLAETRDLPPLLTRIHLHEAVTPFAMLLRGHYARLIGSEFAATERQAQELFPIPPIDASATPFPDGRLDIVLSGDVFEHVPDLAAVLSEVARVLRPGGKLIATFPFMLMQHESDVRARLGASDIVHLATPEFHGNPMDPQGGSLVFQVPGWSILDQARAAGFAAAEMGFWSSSTRGFVSTHVAGIHYLIARR